MISIARGCSGFTLFLVAAVVLTFGTEALLSSRVEAQELITNGSFEDVVGVSPDPDKVPSIMEGPVQLQGWLQTSPSNCGTEIWSYGFIMFADSGDRLVELDAACNGILEQTIDTVPGDKYMLSFAFAGRPKTPITSNAVDVTVGGALIHVQATDRGIWHHYFYVFTATDTSTTIAFAGAGKDDSLGSLLDSVSVTPGSDLTSADCANGGWQYLFGADGSLFKKQRDCVKFFSTN